MAHIAIPEGVPGIIGLLEFDTETAGPLSELAEVLLRRTSGLEPAERELIAAYVSSRNQCAFCTASHGSAARHLLGEGQSGVVEMVWADYRAAPISERLKALLTIAGKVQQDGRLVGAQDIADARGTGATDQEIHDTVLIAAAFCMYNRYVDGLGTWTPTEPAVYDNIGERLAGSGYLRGSAGSPAH